MLDPIREARVRLMVPDESTWPMPALFMKQIKAKWRFGLIRKPASTDIAVEVDGTVEKFATLDALIAAEWAID